MIRLAAVLILLASPAAAETQCAPRPVVVAALAEKFGETRHAIGLNGPGNVVELFGNPETGSWTITITSPQGITCLVTDGSAFVLTADPAPPEGDPT